MEITRVSPSTGKETTMDLDVTPLQLMRWQGGELIQDVMPHLSVDEREFIISGISVGQWENFWNEVFEAGDK